MSGPKYPKVVGELTRQNNFALLRPHLQGSISSSKLGVVLSQREYSNPCDLAPDHQRRFDYRVFEAVNFDDHRVAACKVILITESTTEKDRKNVEKEMRVHSALKHEHVLEFLNAVVVEMKHKAVYIPGIYMLVEYAGGGDLFDKIGEYFFCSPVVIIIRPFR
jgi:hypothetical protein